MKRDNLDEVYRDLRHHRMLSVLYAANIVLLLVGGVFFLFRPTKSGSVLASVTAVVLVFASLWANPVTRLTLRPFMVVVLSMLCMLIWSNHSTGIAWITMGLMGIHQMRRKWIGWGGR